MTERVLLVEDEELVGLMVRLNLESAGFHVTWCRGGARGLALALGGDFDVILLDISLPEVDGREILRRIREREAATPIMMLTARFDIPSKVAALDAGANDYLTKPFDVAELVARVRALVRGSASRSRMAV